MRAMVIRKYGGPEVFEMAEVEIPSISEDDLLVSVKGSSVNPVDCGIRRGLLKSFVKLNIPAILGVDVSGEVMEVGSNVINFKAGDKIYAFMGINRNGGYGEYVVVPASYAAHVPDILDVCEAGVVPGVGMTAYEAFTAYAPIVTGMHVLINGAAGGVGTYAIQIAKAMGAHVTAVCSPHKIDIAKNLGADKVIDYTKENLLRISQRFDVILNCVRGKGQLRFTKLLKPRGKLLVIAGNFFQIPLMKLSNLLFTKKVFMFVVKTDGGILEGLSQLIASSKVKPVIERLYSWENLSEAHRHCEVGVVTGKIGIKVN